MSRIHEALQRVEEEQSSVPVSSAQGVAAAIAREVAPADTLPKALTLQAINVSCAKPQWSSQQDPLMSNSDATLAASEEFRSLRARLYRAREKRPLRTVLVTSAVAGEGKSFVASHVAQVLAQQRGQNVILVDCDLRKPSLHHGLGAPVFPGLSEYLVGNADELSIIQQSPLQNFYFIPAGAQADYPAELIGTQKLRGLIAQLSNIFDWVVIDSAPVITVSDGAVLASYVDGVLLVVNSKSTPFEMAVRARRELQERTLLGVVLNHASADSKKKYSKYYGSDGRYSQYGISVEKAK